MGESELTQTPLGTGPLAPKFSHPLVVGAIIALIGLISSIYVAYINGVNAIKLERQKMVSSLIVESIKTGNKKDAYNNLHFLMKIGFIDDTNGVISSLIENEANIPVLPAVSAASYFGQNRFEPVSTSNTRPEIMNASKAVGLLNIGGDRYCTVWIVAPSVIATSVACLSESDNENTYTKLSFGYPGENKLAKTFEVKLPAHRIDRDLGFALIKVKGQPEKEFGMLELDLRPLVETDELALLHHSHGVELSLSDSTECRVIGVPQNDTQFFYHACATAGGSSGAPILSKDKQKVVGIHQGKAPGENKNYAASVRLIDLDAELNSI